MEDGGDNDNERKREGRCTEGMMEKRVCRGCGKRREEDDWAGRRQAGARPDWA